MGVSALCLKYRELNMTLHSPIHTPRMTNTVSIFILQVLVIKERITYILKELGLVYTQVRRYDIDYMGTSPTTVLLIPSSMDASLLI